MKIGKIHKDQTTTTKLGGLRGVLGVLLGGYSRRSLWRSRRVPSRWGLREEADGGRVQRGVHFLF